MSEQAVRITREIEQIIRKEMIPGNKAAPVLAALESALVFALSNLSPDARKEVVQVLHDNIPDMWKKANELFADHLARMGNLHDEN